MTPSSLRAAIAAAACQSSHADRPRRLSAFLKSSLGASGVPVVAGWDVDCQPMFASPFHQSFAMITLRSRNQACGTAFRAFSLRRLGWTTSLRAPPGEASTPSRSWIARCQDSARVALRVGSMRPSAWRKTAVTRRWPARRRRSVVQLAVSPPARRRCRTTGTSWQASTDRHRWPALRAGLRWWIGRSPSALPRERKVPGGVFQRDEHAAVEQITRAGSENCFQRTQRLVPFGLKFIF